MGHKRPQNHSEIISLGHIGIQFSLSDTRETLWFSTLARHAEKGVVPITTGPVTRNMAARLRRAAFIIDQMGGDNILAPMEEPFPGEVEE